jgi:tripartite-type tricarboxylate transporter receptor subunit TctC
MNTTKAKMPYVYKQGSQKMRLVKAAIVCSLGLVITNAFGTISPSYAQEATPGYFKDKTINIYAGGAAGGGYDTYARLLAMHYSRHIPGNPSFVVLNVPGAGTLKAANYMYEVAAKDGLSIGTINGGNATAELFRSTGIRFDPRYYVWIGSMTSEVGLVLARASSDIKSIDDVFKKEFVVGGGGPSSGNVVFANVLNSVVGTKFKLIAGYKSTGEIALAIDRGEVEGTASYHYSSILTSRPEWISKKEVNVLLQQSLRPHSEFPNVPVAIDLAKTPDQRAILELVLARQEMGRPFLLPPGTPTPIATTLRKGFDAMMRDERLLSDAQRQRLDINNPMTGDDIHKLIDRLYAISPTIVAAAADATGEAGK